MPEITLLKCMFLIFVCVYNLSWEFYYYDLVNLNPSFLPSFFLFSFFSTLYSTSLSPGIRRLICTVEETVTQSEKGE